MRNQFTVNGKSYSTLKAAAEAVGVSSSAVCHKCKNSGLSRQEALDFYSKRERSFTVRGQSFPDFGSACMAIPAKIKSVRHCAHTLGISKQAAIEHYVKKTRGLFWSLFFRCRLPTRRSQPRELL